jgi:hypothetical protein
MVPWAGGLWEHLTTGVDEKALDARGRLTARADKQVVFSACFLLFAFDDWLSDVWIARKTGQTHRRSGRREVASRSTNTAQQLVPRGLAD